jgi:cyclic pyranopterin phosphate synthase
MTTGHFDALGGVRMVDVGDKDTTRRTAAAQGTLSITGKQADVLARGAVAKGDWKTTAQLAGIQGAKKCWELIPLCHPLPIEQIEVDVSLDEAERKVHVTARVSATAKTGVEMEAMCAVSAALLAVYDMIKGIDKAARIEGIELLTKSGGKSGDWKR